MHKSATDRLIILALLLGLLSAAAGSARAARPQRPATTDVGGHITADTTWTLANSPYVATNRVWVDEGVTLTIEPGVVVKFERTYASLIVRGSLVAEGTPGHPIVFTSIKDDAHGRDTNGDGAATSPGPGNWGNLSFSGSGSGSLRHVWIGYAGADGKLSGVGIYETSDVVIRDSTIVHALGDGIRVEDASPTVENSEIAHNSDRGIDIYGLGDVKALTLSGNTFISNTNDAVSAGLTDEVVDVTLTGNTSTGSARNGCRLNGSIAGAVTYSSDADFPFIVQYSLTVREEGTLTVMPGTVTKLIRGDAELWVRGGLEAEGTVEDPIVFTSLHDDAHGGDTNGNGAATTPAPGDWGPINFNATSSGSLRHVWVGYGDQANVEIEGTSDVAIRDSIIVQAAGEAIDVDDASPTIENSIVRENEQEGIAVSGSTSAPTISGCLIQANDVGIELRSGATPVITATEISGNRIGIESWGGNPTIHQNLIWGNAAFGVRNRYTSICLDAENNYWGDPGGPYDASAASDTCGLEGNANPGGDAVSDNVDYEPWLKRPPWTFRNPIPLILGEEAHGSVTHLGWADYSLTLSEGQAVVAAVTPLTGTHDLATYGSVGELPTLAQYDLEGTGPTKRGTHEILIAPAESGTYYLGVFSQDPTSSGEDFRILAQERPRYLSDVAPESAGNAGQATLVVRGLSFPEDAEVELRGSGLPTLTPYSVTVASPTTIWARFDLNGAVLGHYDLAVEWPGDGEEVLSEAFEITVGIGPKLTVELEGPEAVRAGRNYVFWLEYANTGDADMPAPFLLMEPAAGAPISLSRRGDYGTEFLEILGISSDGPAGLLPPGAEHRVPIYFTSVDGANQFDLQVAEPDQTPIDWSAAEAEMRPEDWSNDVWQTLFDALKSRLGSTYEDYHRALLTEANRSSQAGSRVYDVEQLFDLIRLQVAMGLEGNVSLTSNPSTSASGAVDASSSVGFYAIDADGNPTQNMGVLDAGKPTKIILHGWNDGCGDAENENSWQRQIAQAYRDCASDEEPNIVIVDACDLMNVGLFPLNYNYCAANVGLYGEFVANFVLDQGAIDPETLHLIGHSFGSHAAGHAGDRLALAQRPARITALDMAKYAYANEPGLNALSADQIDVYNAKYSLASEDHQVGHEYLIYGCKDEVEQRALHSAPIYWAINSLKDLETGACQQDASPKRAWGLRAEPHEWGQDPNYEVTLDCEGQSTTAGRPGQGGPPPEPQASWLYGYGPEVVRPLDPNEKAGPPGLGPQRLVAVTDTLHYVIYFENVPTATAPAQQVVITDALDPDLDWTSLDFQEVAFGDQVLPFASGTYQSYAREMIPDYRDVITKQWWLDISGEVDPLSGLVRWTFRTLDPETGELPLDALAGFLPPNDESGRGEGHVAFSIQPKPDTPDGTVLINRGTIVFDGQASIVTNEVMNRIGTPGSTVYLPLILRFGTD